ncbi:MAG: signal peptide peptidase SppA [Elusimicrobia bacterium]|nr:signal peptide peptidase SppA [Elusimicrobiota bacterium]
MTDPEPLDPQPLAPPQPGPTSPAATPPSEAPPPAAPPAPDHPAERPGRRKLVIALVALHALSAVAAVVILTRQQKPTPGDGISTSGRLKLLAKREDVVGWVSIRGVIRESEGGRGWGEAGVQQWARRIRSLGDKNEVKAIVLDINSPGGTVGAVQELHSALLRVRREKNKPVVALLGDVAASGGFYLAAGCDKVVAHPGTLVGSIGVIFNSMNIEGLLAKVGVKADPIKSGKHKDIGSSARPMTPEERAILQGLIDNAYGQFLKAVMDGRGLKEEEARPLADGRIFTGDQAKANRLVDELGDSRDAIALAGKLGGISGTPKVLREGDGIESILGMLELGALSWLRPETKLLKELRDVAPSLEYRWLGF